MYLSKVAVALREKAHELDEIGLVLGVATV